MSNEVETTLQEDFEELTKDIENNSISKLEIDVSRDEFLNWYKTKDVDMDDSEHFITTLIKAINNCVKIKNYMTTLDKLDDNIITITFGLSEPMYEWILTDIHRIIREEGINLIDIRFKCDIKANMPNKINNKLNDVLTIVEAAELWKKDVSTLRRNFYANKQFKINVDVRQSGKTWIVTREAMDRVYGKLNSTKK